MFKNLNKFIPKIDIIYYYISYLNTYLVDIKNLISDKKKLQYVVC